jgi:hypothetical protein
MRVMTTPHGTGAPTNLWPLTDTEPIGFLNVTIGAAFTNGICICIRSRDLNKQSTREVMNKSRDQSKLLQMGGEYRTPG